MSSTTTMPASTEQAATTSDRVSFEEFLAQASETTQTEWIDGKVVCMTPASAEHQRLRDFLLRVMSDYVERHGLGEILSAPFLMRLPSRPSGREPDLLFVAAEHLDRLKETFLDGPADLVIEVVSPESDARDRGEKFVEYEAAGIPEYWLIDPLRQAAAFYRLGDDDRYRPAPLDDGGVYRAGVLPGFWLRVDWLWQRPLPRVAQVAQEMMAASPGPAGQPASR